MADLEILCRWECVARPPALSLGCFWLKFQLVGSEVDLLGLLVEELLLPPDDDGMMSGSGNFSRLWGGILKRVSEGDSPRVEDSVNVYSHRGR